MIIVALLCLLTAGFYLFMGSYSILLNKKAGTNLSFLIITMIFAFWSLAALFRNFITSEISVMLWSISSLTAWTIGSSTIVSFIMLLKNKNRKLSAAVRTALYLPAALLFMLQMLNILEIIDKPDSLIKNIVSAVFYITYTTAGMVLLGLWHKNSNKERDKRLSRLIGLSLGTTTVFIIVYGFILPPLVDFILPFLLPVFPIFWISAMWYAVINLKLLEFDPGLAVFELINNVQDLLIITDTDGRIIEVNDEIQNKLGCLKNFLIGKPAEEIIYIDKENTYFRKSEGSYLPIRIKHTDVFDNFGDVIGNVISAQDLTLENKYRLLSVTDPLTGIANRGRLDSVLEYEFTICKRYQRIFSIIMLDIDNFKQINDTHGHQKGDQILILITKTISAELRDGDTFGRYGGEEFMIILPGTDSQQAYSAGEKLRKKIEELSLGAIENITISSGISQLEKNDVRVEQIVKRADNALYSAKEKGKNCTVRG